jgi:ribosomal protein S18 acetylase RimI-like enzyme
MEIRTAEKKDVKIVMEFEFELFQKWDRMDKIDMIDETWFNSNEHLKKTLKIIKDTSKQIFLAFEKNTCLGYLKAEISERELFLKKVGYVSEVYIITNARGKYVGSALLDKALEWFKKNNILWTTVSTHSKDVEAIGFWEKKGYKEYNKFFKMKV